MQHESIYARSFIQPMQFNFNTQFSMNIQPVVLQTRSLSINLPQFDYKTSKQALVPFDKKSCDNGVFTCLDDAMKYIGKHSLKFHGQFNRQLAKSYSPFCQIVDFVNGGFQPLSEVSKREFNSSFQRISKMLQ